LTLKITVPEGLTEDQLKIVVKAIRDLRKELGRNLVVVEASPELKNKMKEICRKC